MIQIIIAQWVSATHSALTGDEAIIACLTAAHAIFMNMFIEVDEKGRSWWGAFYDAALNPDTIFSAQELFILLIFFLRETEPNLWFGLIELHLLLGNKLRRKTVGNRFKEHSEMKILSNFLKFAFSNFFNRVLTRGVLTLIMDGSEDTLLQPKAPNTRGLTWVLAPATLVAYDKGIS